MEFLMQGFWQWPTLGIYLWGTFVMFTKSARNIHEGVIEDMGVLTFFIFLILLPAQFLLSSIVFAWLVNAVWGTECLTLVKSMYTLSLLMFVLPEDPPSLTLLARLLSGLKK
jgi:hypothetical protein